MALLATQQIVNTGLSPAYAAAAAGGDTFVPGDRTFLHIKNTNAAARNVTVDSKAPSNYGTDADLAVNVPLTVGDKMIGPLPASRFADPATGLGNLTYDAVTGVTVAIITL
jgi:hypothetical protein